MPGVNIKVTEIVLVVGHSYVLVDFEREHIDKLYATCDGFAVYIRNENKIKLAKRYAQIDHAALVAVQACGGHAGMLHKVKRPQKKRGSKAFEFMKNNSERMF